MKTTHSKNPPGKADYRMPPFKNEFTGMDIFIDPNTQKLCETYNQSSGATRSVLYLLLIVCAISIIAVFNSNWAFNWTTDRINRAQNRVINDRMLLRNTKGAWQIDSSKLLQKPPGEDAKATRSGPSLAQRDSAYSDTLIRETTRLASDQKQLDALIAADVANNETVNVSIIGVSIDVNDLASISGLTLIILLTVLRFTLTREKHNLKLAFNSINERYSDQSDHLKLKEEYIRQALEGDYPSEAEDADKEEGAKNDPSASNKNETVEQLLKKRELSKTKDKWEELIFDINFIRRRYHYNYLSMNEVFNMPLLDTNKDEGDDSLQASKKKKSNESWLEDIVKSFINYYLFFFFLFVYSYIIFNDFCSIKIGLAENNHHTILIMVISFLCYIVIFNICRDCVEHKIIINTLFKNFFKNYRYDYGDYSIEKLSLVKVFGIPIGLLIGLFLLSQLIILFK